MDDIIKYDNDTKIADKSDYDVYLAEEFINNTQPISTIVLPRAEYPLMFYQTRDSLADVDRYKSFIDNCVSRFRRSRAYKGYKAYLMCLGLDRCQINGNISDGMANVEMHHNFLTIFDITILISQHILNTVGRCTTFDIVQLLIQEHRNNNIPIVMLSETAHQLYHSDPDMYIPISMTFGQWWDLLLKYRYGITLDIAYKVVKYIDNCQKNNELTDVSYYQLSDTIKSWGDYNEYANYNIINNTSTPIGKYINSNNYSITSIEQNSSTSNANEYNSNRVYTEDELFGSIF